MSNYEETECTECFTVQTLKCNQYKCFGKFENNGENETRTQWISLLFSRKARKGINTKCFLTNLSFQLKKK